MSSTRHGGNFQLELAAGTLLPKEMPGINAFTFYDYLLDLAQSGASPESVLSVEPIYHRLAYISRLVAWIDASGFSHGTLPRLFLSTEPPTAEQIKSNLSPSDIEQILFFVESETKQQVGCDLWKVLRQFLLTASTLKWVKNRPCSKPDWFKVNEFRNGGAGYARQAMAITFGLTNESCARKLIMTYVSGDLHRHQNDSGEFFRLDVGESDEDAFSCGLLLDKRSGMLGASMDMAVMRKDPETAAVAEIDVFEIKCRAKYTFCPENLMHPLSACYERMLDSPGEETIRDFLFGIRAPGVEYFPPDSVPSAAEALLTCAKGWASPDAKASTRDRGSLIEKRHLQLNREVRSTVYLFGEPCLKTNSIRPIVWPSGGTSCELPIFINPKHQNFKQIFVQTYVLADYYPDAKISQYLVTFIGRSRRANEFGRVLRLDGGREDLAEPISLDHIHAIPILLIKTPVVIDRDHFSDLSSLGKEAFEFSVKETWGNAADAAAAPRIGRGCAAKKPGPTELLCAPESTQH
ncbi:ICP18 [Psittacid alphaherpesvirus 1]|uniref:Alkaline nuclease n=1 Tax=Psittacid herpesvirus 1 (isolate Amazon parrot/-/97-0001/1997) TaxID=670426 RepID=AN_PSHV1|nr:deoxyribonuclease [Psittacid alphaherpesvirus 1]Q6UDH6.1 RecName: Full=Alkaline nuclease [Psittacid herpesvirus 1 Amazon parrot/1997]AAQ73734.1 ICP18 [Psittacid alphaherpesvirus 1]